MIEIIIAVMLIINGFSLWRISYYLMKSEQRFYDIYVQLYNIWDALTD